MAYIGRQNLGGAYRQLDDISSGFDGSDTTHTMQVNSANVTVGDVNQIILSLGGVIQKPGTDFTVSGSVLTFTTAPAANTSFFAVLLGSDNGGTTTPTDVSVTKAKLADSIDVFAGTSLSAADLGVGVHIKTADASVSSLNSAADELVLENSASCGLSILSGTSEVGKIAFGDSGDNNIGEIFYNHSINEMIFTNNTYESLRIGANLDLSTGGEDAPDVSEGGLCLDQNAADNPILSLKSSDIGIHSNSGFESDTYFHIGKLSGTTGGTIIRSFSEAGAADVFEFRSLMGQAGNDTTKSTSSNAPFMFKAADIHSTEGIRAMADGGTNSNLFIISDHTTRRFIFDSEGDLHSDSSNTTFDSYEDAHLVRAFDLSHGRGVIDSKFDEFVKYKHEDLANIGLVGREDDGTPNHFINITGFQRLHNGAIWQQYEKTERLANAMYELAKAAVGEEKANEILEQNDITLLN